MTSMTKEEKEKEAIRRELHVLMRQRPCAYCQINYTLDAIEILTLAEETAVAKIKCTKCGNMLGMAIIGRPQR